MVSADINQTLFKSNEIHVGEWCLYNKDMTSAPSITFSIRNVVPNVLLGSILAFKYTEGKMEKDKQCHNDFVTVLNETVEKKRENVEVLSSWYMLNFDGILISLGIDCHFFLNIKHYILYQKKLTKKT